MPAAMETGGNVRKVFIRALAVLALVGAGVLASVAPASAVPSGCTSGWSSWIGSGGGWGQFRWCTADDAGDNSHIIVYQVDDTATDGYRVHMEYSTDFSCTSWCDEIGGGGSGPYCESSGAVFTCEAHLFYGTGGFVYARIVQGRSSSPAQHIQYGSSHLVMVF